MKRRSHVIPTTSFPIPKPINITIPPPSMFTLYSPPAQRVLDPLPHTCMQTCLSLNFLGNWRTTRE